MKTYATEVLKRCRHALTTCIGDDPSDLRRTARSKVLRLRAAECSMAILYPKAPESDWDRLDGEAKVNAGWPE